MIQTQLLKSDKPYQIISAAGMVGVQVATLIVTEEKTLASGRYIIDTHSHPVVNYANKEGLVEELKYFNGDPAEEYKYTWRMRPEGAVWNKVEVRDVQVLGLVGAKNPNIDISTFFDLIPSSTPDTPLLHLWDLKTGSKIRNLYYDLNRMGIKVTREVTYSEADYNTTYDSKNKTIFLELEEIGALHRVMVKIRESNNKTIPFIYPLYFRCGLEEDPTDCIRTIESCFDELCLHFDFQGKLKFVYNRIETDKDNKWADILERVTESINTRK